MAEQYEIVWKSKNKKYYERVRDTITKEVKIRQFKPVYEIFEETSNKNSSYKYLLNENIFLNKKEFNDAKSFREYLGLCDTIGKTIYGIQNPEYSHIRENYFDNGLIVEPRIWCLDIEAIPPKGAGFPDPIEAKFPINCIQIYDNYIDKNIIIATRALSDKQAFLDRNPNTILKMCQNEKHLFTVFLDLMDALKPSIINAWNGEGFDFPYITNRAKQINGINYRKLSPVKVINEREIASGGVIVEWEGITLVDTMVAYQSFTYVTRTSYSLDNIAKEELGMGSGKVDYGEHEDIISFFEDDYDKFMDYAVQDVVILKKLEDKLSLNHLLIMLAYMMGINPADAFGTVKPWSTFLYNVAYKRNLIMPKTTKHNLDHGIVGGYVAKPVKGLHKWIASIDVNSMYPLLGFVAHNMSAETYIPYYDLPDDAKELYDKYMRDENENIFTKPLFDNQGNMLSQDEQAGMADITLEIQKICQKYNYSFGINAFFKNDKLGLIPEITYNVYKDRKIAKEKMLKYKAFKTLLS